MVSKGFEQFELLKARNEKISTYECTLKNLRVDFLKRLKHFWTKKVGLKLKTTIMMRFDMPKEQSSIIKVIGVGGGGSNAVNHMYRQGIKGSRLYSLQYRSSST